MIAALNSCQMFNLQMGSMCTLKSSRHIRAKPWPASILSLPVLPHCKNPYSEILDWSEQDISNYFTSLVPLDGAAAAVLASEAFVQKHDLKSKAGEILAQEMVTDMPSSFEDKSVIKWKIEVCFIIRSWEIFFKV